MDVNGREPLGQGSFFQVLGCPAGKVIGVLASGKAVLAKGVVNMKKDRRLIKSASYQFLSGEACLRRPATIAPRRFRESFGRLSCWSVRSIFSMACCRFAKRSVNSQRGFPDLLRSCHAYIFDLLPVCTTCNVDSTLLAIPESRVTLRKPSSQAVKSASG